MPGSISVGNDGYRWVTYLMMNADIVAANPGSIYRVLSQAGALRRWEAKPSKKRQRGPPFAEIMSPKEHQGIFD